MRAQFIKPARTISILTLFSRVLGVVRDAFTAAIVGVGLWLDAFLFAFIIPNLARRLFGEGALTSAFVPVYAEHVREKDEFSRRRLLGAVTTLLSIVLLILIALGYGATFIIDACVECFVTNLEEGKKLLEITSLLRIMMPYIFLICMTALIGAMLNSAKHFAMPAFAPILLNLTWIAALLFFIPLFEGGAYAHVRVLAVAVLVAGVLQLAVQIPVLLKKNMRFGLCFDFNQPGIVEMKALFLPSVFGLAVFQVNVLLDNVVAEAFVPGHGAVSYLYLGNRFVQFPLALIGIAIAQAAFPFMAEHAARGDMARMKEAVSEALRLGLFIAIPASVGLMLVSLPVTRLIFEYGKFSAEDSHRAAGVIFFYATGLWAYCALQVVTRAFHSLKDMKTPVKVGIGTVFLNLVLNLIMVQFLREAGLALATAITSVVNLVILCLVLSTKVGGMEWKWVGQTAAKSVVAASAMAVVCAGAMHLVCDTGGSVTGRVLMLLLPVIAGVISYTAISLALGSADMFRAIFRRRERD